MKIIDVAQGTPEWRAARCGIPTASCFDKIIRPSDGKLSASADKYLARLLAEWWTGQPIDDYVSPHMERGTELEGEARDWYSWDSGHDVQQVGFCTTDDGLVGCSPDGLVEPDGGLELKTPGIETHMVYLLDPKKLVADYRCQVQGCLMVTGRKWWDLCSFSPILPNVRERIICDTDFIDAMRAAVDQFNERLAAAKRRFAEAKSERDRTLAAVADSSHSF